VGSTNSRLGTRAGAPASLRPSVAMSMPPGAAARCRALHNVSSAPRRRHRCLCSHQENPHVTSGYAIKHSGPGGSE
jgi:hypothetical protein